MRPDYLLWTFQRELSFGRFFTREQEWLPPTDVYETEREFVVLVEIPGVERDQIKVSFNEGVLTIRGERRDLARGTGVRFHQMEITYGRFVREICFPTPIDKERIRARYSKGILKVVLPKL